MKVYNLKIIKIVIITIFILMISVISSNSYAYQIKTTVIPKQYLNNYGKSDFPEMLYRKRTAAHTTTVTKYKFGAYEKDATTGWVYASTIKGSYPTDNTITKKWDSYKHERWDTFVRVYEYFHKNQNSNYRLESADGYTEKKYSTGELKSTDKPELTPIGTGKYYNVYSETGNYAGVYPFGLTPDNISAGKVPIVDSEKYNNSSDILIMDTNLYRFAIVNNNIYVSDNSLTQETMKELWKRFGESSYDRTLKVYNSSVLRTGKANGKYYQDMDTAYKFLQTTSYGSTPWYSSSTILGGWDGSSSFVNYYDNIFEIPVGQPMNIYVRHIDVSGMQNVTAENVKSRVISKSQIANSRILEISGWVGDIPVFEKYHNRQTMDNYSDYYKIALDYNVSYIVGNMRYKNNYYASNKTDKIAVSSLSKVLEECTSVEQNILNSYKCLGYTIGKGASLNAAEVARDNNINSLKTTDNLKNGNGDWTNTIISSNDQDNYVVVDFYYEKPQNKKIYVRHIDVSGMENMTSDNVKSKVISGTNTQNGRLIEISGWVGDTPIFSQYHNKQNVANYSDYYALTTTNNLSYIVGNMRYKNNYYASNKTDKIAVSSLSKSLEQCTNIEKNILNSYKCLGYTIGKGSSLNAAEVARDASINKLKIKEALTGNDWTSAVIPSSDGAEYVVVDFYYEKPQKKKIYVRHIDVSGIKDMTPKTVTDNVIKSEYTQNGQVIEISGWIGKTPIFSQYHKKQNADKYNDYYDLTTTSNLSYVVGNIKYNSNYYQSNEKDKIAVSSLSKVLEECTSVEQNILNKYRCIGYTTGKGSSLNAAEVARDASIKKLKTKESLTGNDWTSAIVPSSDGAEYVVVDFYYEKPPSNMILVRHIDLTSYGGKITKSNVDRCIQEGHILSGRGIAYYSPFGKDNTISSAGSSDQYQELYYINPDKYLRVYAHKDEKYECIGTNVTSSIVNLSDAKAKMNERLSGNPTSLSAAEYKEVSAANEVTIVDFYYKEKVEEIELEPIERNPVGRLSYYTTLSEDDKKFNNVNDNTTSNNQVVIDTIPSGESLRPSINGAYRYMLAGINIEETKDDGDDHYLTYTIVQPFKIYCRDGVTTFTKDYSTKYKYTRENKDGEVVEEDTKDYTHNVIGDISGGINVDSECTGSYIEYVWYNSKGNVQRDRVYHNISEHGAKYYDSETYNELKVSCSGFYKTNWTYNSGTLNFILKYKVELPYICTFYKIKNIRTYTISKLELLDGYSNAALPLFDGNTHIFYTSDAYKELFTNGHFYNAGFNSNLSRPSITLPSLDVYYNNINDPIRMSKTDISNGANNYKIVLDSESIAYNLETLASKIDNSEVVNKLKKLGLNDIAKLTGFESKDVENEYSISRGGIQIGTTGKVIKDKEALKATMTLTNDRLTLNNGTYLVGEYTSPKDIKTNEEKSYGVNEKTQTEAEARIEIDLSKYNGQTINLSTLYPKSIRSPKDISTNDKKAAIGSQYLPSSSLTRSGDFKSTDENGQTLTIPAFSLNGKRYSYAKVYYSIDDTYSLFNFNINSVTIPYNHTSTNSVYNTTYTSNNGYSWLYNDPFNDTEMYNMEGKVGSPATKIDPTKLGEIVWEYGANNTFDKIKNTPNKFSKDADVVDVFTPISFSADVLKANRTETEGYVDHTVKVKENGEEETTVVQSNQIQKNARFTIGLEAINYTGAGYNNAPTNKYLKEYYIKFNFDVQDIVIYDAKSTSEGRRHEVGVVPQDTWIGPIYNLDENGTPAGTVKISAFALADANEANGLVNQEQNTYTVRATSYNIPDNLIYDLNMGNISETTKFINSGNKNIYDNNYKQSHQDYYWKTDILGHNMYVAEEEYITTNINRMYDFKITDLKDIDWKNIFRKSTSANTNIHTSKAYYSGIYKWNVYTTKVSEMMTRDVSEIGVTQQQTLPIGPYKHTNTTYKKAPKLGYKFSFDLKTTGAITNKISKKIVIEPRFYYVGKDGTGYTKDIRLFYKNSNNKYVPIENYNIYFVPDDGYRLTFEGTDAENRLFENKDNKTIINSTVKLGNTKKITLTDKMMQRADQAFVQIWYGEYKLPNSTIAVKVNPSNSKDYNINEKLTDGYIGVIFDITSEEYNDGKFVRKISYSRDDKNFLAGSNHNTSQWDYEGYLGIKEVGKEIADPSASASANIGKQRISIQLEKGEWQLDDTMYNDIKGTVILYDTDAKASSDYD